MAISTVLPSEITDRIDPYKYPAPLPPGRVTPPPAPWYGSAPEVKYTPPAPIQTKTSQIGLGPRDRGEYESLKKYFADVDRITAQYQQRYGMGQKPSAEYLRAQGIEKPTFNTPLPIYGIHLSPFQYPQPKAQQTQPPSITQPQPPFIRVRPLPIKPKIGGGYYTPGID